MRANGELEYYRGSHRRGSFSVLSSVIILSRHDARRFEIDTGRGIWHLRTTTAADRDVWVKKISEIAPPSAKTSKAASSPTAVLEAQIQALKYNIGVARSLETVLVNRIEAIKNDPRASAIAMESVAEHHSGAIVVEDDSAEHHKKKKRGHTRTKSEEIGGPTFLQQAQEIHRCVSQLITSVDAMSVELADAVSKLDSLSRSDTTSSLNVQLHKTKQGGSGSASISEDPSPPDEPVILFDAGDHSGSDSEDYFDADVDSDEMPVTNEDDSSSSAEYFDHDGHFQESGSSSNIPGSPSSTKGDKKSKSARRTSMDDSRVSMTISTVPKPSGVSVKDSLAEVPSNWAPRNALPFDKPKGVPIPIMKILKDAVGKDITRITIPVQFSEPINMLQRLAEDFEYAEHLIQAAEEEDPRTRLLLVSAFAASSYASIYVRRTKPFNPILGETFEFVDKEKQFRLMTEQVSHHPPISAFSVDSHGYSMWGYACAKTKFWGKSLEINPSGDIFLKLFKYDEIYTWNKLTTCMNNVIVGNKWIDNYGELTVVNQTSGLKCVMDFKKSGWFGAHQYEIEGTAYDADDTPSFRVFGMWNDYVASIPHGAPEGDLTNKKVLWKRTPLPEHSDKQYYFTSYTMRMNELAEWMKPLLPPTDSRWRPDQRALEDVQLDTAQDEKARLEDVQRAARKKLEEAGQEYQPNWFRKEGDTWVYKGGYWEARKAGKWPKDLPTLW